MKLDPRVKLILDILPLPVFFAVYKFFGVFAATGALIVITICILALLYAVERRIAFAPLITAVLVTIFGGLTLWLKDDTFIKIKPTLLYLIFAAILLGGCFFKKGLIQYILGAAFNLTDEGWRLLSLRWAGFFTVMAILNEYVWHNFPTSTWVNFKVFGLFGLTLVFAVLQTGLMKRHQQQPS